MSGWRSEIEVEEWDEGWAVFFTGPDDTTVLLQRDGDSLIWQTYYGDDVCGAPLFQSEHEAREALAQAPDPAG